MQNQKLSRIPEYIFQRENLRELKLTGNCIREIPNDICRLEYLHSLTLDSNNLVGLPTALGGLCFLKILNVSHNNISELDGRLYLPKSLLEARFSDNTLKHLPRNLFMSSRLLQVLDCSMNELVQLSNHDWETLLPNLESFDLQGNKLQKIPASLLRMPRLCTLNVSKNNLFELIDSHLGTERDVDVFNLSPTLKSIACNHNPFLFCPPPEILTLGGDKVVEYLQQSQCFHKVKILKTKIARLEPEEDLSRGWSKKHHTPSVDIARDSSSLDALFTTLDINSSGEITIDELRAYMLSKDPKVTEEQVQDRFNLMDRDKDGGITKMELAEFLKNELSKLKPLETRADLEQNTTFCLIATGMDENCLVSLLDMIGAECPSTAIANVRKHSHGSWSLESAGDKAGEMNITLKILLMHGSHLLTKRQGKENMLRLASEAEFRNGIFQVRRAVFLLAWRMYVGDNESAMADQEISETTELIKIIKESLPHTRIFVIPTVARATDLSGYKVNDLIVELKKSVCEHGNSVHLFADAVCIQENYAGQQCMQDLKQSLRACVSSSPFFGELLPSYVFRLRKRLEAEENAYLSWDVYKQLAKASGVPSGGEALHLTTTFLQEMGEIKYFGRFPCGRSSICNHLLTDTVFINMAWIMDVVDTLMDADTSKMISFLADQDPSLSFLASIFVSDGILHPRLMPFIWPSLSNREKWPGVDSNLIVRYWAQEDETTRAGPRGMLIATDAASLQRAFVACVGLQVALEEDASNTRFARYLVRNTTHSGYSGNLHTAIIPRLGFKATWHEPRYLSFGKNPMCCQIFRVHLDSKTYISEQMCQDVATEHEEFINTEQTLTVYESIKIIRMSTIKRNGPPLPRTGQRILYECPTSVYQYQQEHEVYGAHTIADQILRTHLRRTLRVSMKRRDLDAKSFVGCAAVLSMPTNQEETRNMYWDAIKDLPVHLFTGESVRVEHTIVLFRVSLDFDPVDLPSMVDDTRHKTTEAGLDSAVDNHGKSKGQGSFANVLSGLPFEQLTLNRMDFERHLFYMLLSDPKGVNYLKSLMHGHSPTDFLINMRELYKDLRAASSARINTIHGAIKSLNGYLISLDVSNNPSLKGISAKDICQIESLQFLECLGSPNVYTLPPEVGKLGGKKAIEYLRSANEMSTENKDLQIIVIGNGEAGKTSIIKCILSEDNKSDEISGDARTVGVDIVQWKPTPFYLDKQTNQYVNHFDHAFDSSESVIKVDPDGATFSFLDLGGQRLYQSSNQFWLVPRALYIVAWRVVKPKQNGAGINDWATAQELESMIVDWLDSLHARVPGASIVMVATHIDAVLVDSISSASAAKELQKQCNFVKQIVTKKLDEIHSRAAKAGVAVLEVYDCGQSIKLNCLKGEGVPQLKRVLIEMAHTLPWWKEFIPTSYHRLKEVIMGLQIKGSVWLTWKEFEELATQTCGMEKNQLSIATHFLSDTAVIKYFGRLKDDGRPVDDKQILDNTVFINQQWFIDSLKGLIRHDRQILMEYIQSNDFQKICPGNKSFLRHLNRLGTHGILGQELIPFLWPNGGTDGFGQGYWEWLKQNNKESELRLWRKNEKESKLNFAKNEEDYNRAITLLKGCGFVIEHSGNTGHVEYRAPCLLVQDGSIDARSFFDGDCPLKHVYNVTGMAAGFVERLFAGVADFHTHIEYSKDIGIFYGRGLKAQIFCVQDEGTNGVNYFTDRAGASLPTRRLSRKTNKTVPTASSLMEKITEFETSYKPVTAKLTVATSTREQQKLISKEIARLQDFFPGMSIGPFPDATLLDADKDAERKEPVQVRIVSLDETVARKVKKLLEDTVSQKERTAKDALPLKIDAGKYDSDRQDGDLNNSEKYMDFDSRLVVLCMTSVDTHQYEAEKAAKLRLALVKYEEDYLCRGEIICEQSSLFVSSHYKKVPSLSSTDLNRLEDEVAHYMKIKEYKKAKEKLRQIFWVRKAQKHKELRFFIEWHSDHTNRIHMIFNEIDKCHRMSETHGSTGPNIFTEELKLLQEIQVAEKILRQCHEKETALYGSLCFRAGHVTAPDVEPEKFRDLVAKTTYFEDKYHILWTRLDLRQICRRIGTHIPELKRNILRLQGMKCSISDMRRAHDAFKGNHQEADKLETNVSLKTKQFKEIDALEKEIRTLDSHLASEIEWRVFLGEFEWHVRKNRQILALICPGYFDMLKKKYQQLNYNKWWPNDMPEMSNYALFIDMTTNANLKKEVKVEDVSLKLGGLLDIYGTPALSERIEGFLQNWRGPAPEPKVFDIPSSIPCQMCLDEQEKDPYMFNRIDCENALSKWKVRQLQAREDCFSGDSSQIMVDFDSAELDDSIVMQCERNPKHRLQAQDLLTQSVIFEAVPCPRCLKHNDLPPATWNRKKLMAFFAVPSGAETWTMSTETKIKKEGEVDCPKCRRARRPNMIPIIELIKPQVFFSYNWGSAITLPDGRKGLSTQAHVIPLRNRVELSTDLLVWLDVGGGMQYGQNHINLMAEGIKNSVVVVIFLSDAYVNSPNCQREYLHSVRNCKYIVPVLLPPEERSPNDPKSDVNNISEYVPNSGWTGKYDEHEHSKFWCQHIYSVIRRNSDGSSVRLKYDPDDASKKIDWRCLGAFRPIDMREAFKSQTLDSKEEKKLIELIMSRFHRGKHIDHGTLRKYGSWKNQMDGMQVLLAGFENESIETLTENKINEMSLKIFKKIDNDGSTSIDAHEVKQFLKMSGVEITQETANQLINEADDDNAGCIKFPEFKAVITELLNARKEEKDEKRSKFKI